MQMFSPWSLDMPGLYQYLELSWTNLELRRFSASSMPLEGVTLHLDVGGNSLVVVEKDTWNWAEEVEGFPADFIEEVPVQSDTLWRGDERCFSGRGGWG